MRIASLVYRRHLASHGPMRSIWSFVRRIATRLLDDPTVELPVHGRPMKMPLSHQLPVYLDRFAHYDRLPQRLGDYLRSKYGQLCCVDVGANVGDTIAAFHPHADDRFLAIEPNPRFNRLLTANWSANPNVTIISDVCSSQATEQTFSVRETAGTASIVADSGGHVMRARPLDQIVLDTPFAATANMLKVDTDGHDFQVLAGAEKLISSRRPAVLFECDAWDDQDYVAHCLGALRDFKEKGYDGFLLYDNFGYLMGRHSLDDLTPLRQLLFYQLTSRFYYFDILLMRGEDLVEFHSAEVRYFVDHMTKPSLRNTALWAAQA